MEQPMRNRVGRLVLLALSLSGPALAQATTEGSSPADANAFFEAQNWKAAAGAYEAIVAREPANASAWFRLGVSRHSLQQYEAALAAYDQAYQNGFVLTGLPVRAAIAHARLNQPEEALAWLEKGLRMGLGAQMLNVLPGLESLRQDSRFQELQARYEHPCRQSEYRVFDFWLGEWEVQDTQGQLVGTNSIQKLLDGCVLFENWTGGSGGTGKSFNFYHPGRGKWKQTWVDDTGRVLDVEGEFRDGAMRFEGEVTQKDGSRILDRMTFFPLGPDRVRQLIEQSADGGTTWSVWFDGTYVRKMSD